MKSVLNISLTTLMLGAYALTACVDPNDIKKIKENQKEILTKLEAIEKKGGAGGRAAPPKRPNRPDPSKVYAFPAGESASNGPKDAWVTIVEVSDFQCPFCSRVGPTLKQIKAKYKDDVRIVFKHNPLGFHQRAMPAAQAAECAGEQNKFWEMHDELFANQKALSDEQLEGYAKKIGIDAGKWKACYSSGKHKARIQGDQRTAMSLGARGTPAFFINGRFLSGAQPFPNFDKLVSEELEKAKKSGIPKGEYYQKTVVAKGAKKVG